MLSFILELILSTLCFNSLSCFLASANSLINFPSISYHLCLSCYTALSISGSGFAWAYSCSNADCSSSHFTSSFRLSTFVLTIWTFPQSYSLFPGSCEEADEVPLVQSTTVPPPRWLLAEFLWRYHKENYSTLQLNITFPGAVITFPPWYKRVFAFGYQLSVMFISMRWNSWLYSK